MGKYKIAAMYMYSASGVSYSVIYQFRVLASILWST